MEWIQMYIYGGNFQRTAPKPHWNPNPKLYEPTKGPKTGEYDLYFATARSLGQKVKSYDEWANYH